MAMTRALTLALVGVLLPGSAPTAAVCNDDEELPAQIEHLRAYAPNIEFPSAGALFEHVTENDGDRIDPKGSGALIAPTVFMTCRHCIDGFPHEPETLFVFLPGEGNIKVRKIWSYCEHQCGDHGGNCSSSDKEVHDIALVELDRAATVWPAIALAPGDPGEQAEGAYAGRRAAFGGRCGGWPKGIKAVHKVQLQDCDEFDDPETMVCQPEPNLPISGDSGGPLLNEGGAGSWVQSAVTKAAMIPGGQTASWGRYVKAWHPQYKDWIACQLDKAAQSAATSDQVESLEIKWWGRVEQGYVSPSAQVPEVIKVIAAPEHFESWELPVLPSDAEPDWIHIPAGAGVTKLRVTLNHLALTSFGHSVRMKLRLHPPESSGLPTELCEGHTFVQCDVNDPTEGAWRIEVTAEDRRDSGLYQLVALPLGPVQSSEFDRRIDAKSPELPRGATWHSGPVMRVNTEADGSPSAAIMRLFDIDRRRAIYSLQEELSRAGLEPPE